MQYYHNLIDELIANNIIPLVTLYHWDLPQPLQNEGGWLNESIVGKFQDYTEKCFAELGSKVQCPTLESIVLAGYSYFGYFSDFFKDSSTESSYQ